MPLWPFLLAYLAPGCAVAGWCLYRLRNELIFFPRPRLAHPDHLKLPVFFACVALAWPLVAWLAWRDR